MKDRIIEAAVYEILHNGLKFSIREVSARAGISTKTLYQYFESKEQIINEMVEQSIVEMKEKERALLSGSSLTIRQKLKDALVVLPGGFAFGDIRILNDLKKRYPSQWAKIDNYLNEGWDNIRLLVSEGVSEGEIRSFDMELFIQVYVGALYHLMENQMAGRSGRTLEESLASMVELLLEGI
ncbi:TetR family transcriptional regulator [Paenibacillus sp. NEAU-GSW1]|nr:TetR family transcriptional regulator [Paenibacillus sp. NEAU-GSW1]